MGSIADPVSLRNIATKLQLSANTVLTNISSHPRLNSPEQQAMLLRVKTMTEEIGKLLGDIFRPLPSPPETAPYIPTMASNLAELSYPGTYNTYDASDPFSTIISPQVFGLPMTHRPQASAPQSENRQVSHKRVNQSVDEDDAEDEPQTGEAKSRAQVFTENLMNNQKEAVSWLKDNYMYRDTTLCRELFYRDYVLFCEAKNLVPLSCSGFGKLVRGVFPNVKSRRLGARGQSKYHYFGLGYSNHLGTNGQGGSVCDDFNSVPGGCAGVLATVQAHKTSLPVSSAPPSSIPKQMPAQLAIAPPPLHAGHNRDHGFGLPEIKSEPEWLGSFGDISSPYPQDYGYAYAQTPQHDHLSGLAQSSPAPFQDYLSTDGIRKERRVEPYDMYGFVSAALTQPPRSQAYAGDSFVSVKAPHLHTTRIEDDHGSCTLCGFKRYDDDSEF